MLVSNSHHFVNTMEQTDHIKYGKRNGRLIYEYIQSISFSILNCTISKEVFISVICMYLVSKIIM